MALSLLTVSAHAFQPWTSTGSAGVMDESTAATDLAPSKVYFTDTYAKLRTSPSTNTATLRYNVTATFDSSYAFTPYLQVRFKASTSSTRVIARLRSYDTNTGSTATLGVIDSNSFLRSSGFQTQAKCLSGKRINEFDSKVYWVEVELSRTSSTGSADLAAVRVSDCPLI